MKINTTLLSIVSLVLSFTFAQAATKKTKVEPKPAPSSNADEPKKPEPSNDETKIEVKSKITYPLYGDVASVEPKSLTIKGGEGKPDRKFIISQDTKIVNGEKSVEFSDIKVGWKIGGIVEKEDSGLDQLLKINIGVKQDRVMEKPQTKEAEPKIEEQKEEKKVEEKPKTEAKPKPKVKKRSA